MSEGERLDLQGGESSILQLTETPFVGIGNEFNGLRTQDLERAPLARFVGAELLVGNKEILCEKSFCKARRVEKLKVVSVDLVHLALEDSAFQVNEPAWVPEGRT
jgi:hypothetical protein